MLIYIAHIYILINIIGFIIGIKTYFQDFRYSDEYKKFTSCFDDLLLVHGVGFVIGYNLLYFSLKRYKARKIHKDINYRNFGQDGSRTIFTKKYLMMYVSHDCNRYIKDFRID